MAVLKACSALVTGANRGLGLEMVNQLLEARCSNIFAACRDPDGPNSEVNIQELRFEDSFFYHSHSLSDSDTERTGQKASRCYLPCAAW